MNYESDEALQEIHDEMYGQEESRPKSAISGFDASTRFFIGLVVAAVVILIIFEKVSIKHGLLFLAAGAAIIYFMKGTERKDQELTWLECMMRVNDLLKFLQNHPIGDTRQIPKGEVNIKPIGRKQWYDGRPFKRSYAVDIYDDDKDITEMYFIEVDVYTGDIITFRHAPQGVYGDETKDVKLLPSPDMLVSKKRDQFLSPKYKI